MPKMCEFRVSKAMAILIFLTSFPALGWAQGDNSFAGPKPWRWPTELGGVAHNIHLNSSGRPVLSKVPTALPVLVYGGKSSDGQLLAYLPLAKLEKEAPQGRTYIPIDDVQPETRSLLVPTGELVIERVQDGSYERIDLPGQYVIAVAWSPIDPTLLSYTFSRGSTYGLAVLDVENPVPLVIENSSILADFIRWSPSGTDLDFYKRDLSVEGMAPTGYARSVFLEKRYSLVTAKSAAPEEISSWPFQLARLLPSSTTDPGSGHQAFSASLAGSYTVRGDNILGISQLSISSVQSRQLITEPAHKFVTTLPTGVVFKRHSPEGNSLHYLSLDGRLTTLQQTKSTTTYKIPFHHSYSPDMTVTQVGQSLSTKCNVSSHIGDLSNAYDMQAKAGNEAILLAGTGTVAYVNNKVTCNSSDEVGCSDYSPSCNSAASNGNWGNTVIIQHADGTWTKYSHLRYGSVIPTTVGRSAMIGCRLGTEGHTGASTGNKNGCGDHLHFQRQAMSSRDAVSMSISFSDATSPLSCKSYESQNAGQSCAF